MKRTLLVANILLAISLQSQSCSTVESSAADFGRDINDEDTTLAPATDFIDDTFFPSTINEAVSTYNIFATMESDQICSAEIGVQYAAQPPTRSTAGPVLVREAAASGSLPKTPIRDEEFLNYYSRGYPLPETDQPYVSLSAVRASNDAEPVAYDLQLAVFTAKASKETRRRLNMVLAVDTSTSMSGRGMTIAKAACRATADLFRKGDSVSIVTWDAEASVEYQILSIPESGIVDYLAVCDGLTSHANTATDLRSGLTTAYEIASLSADENTINHILFLSDGGATAGVTDKETIKSFAERTDAPPIYLTAVGTAKSFSQYNESLMKMFADAGNGDHYYLESENAAVSAIRDSFGTRLETVGRNTDIRLTLPSGQTVPEDLLNPGGLDTLPKGRRLESGSSWIINTEAIPCDALSGDILENASFYLSLTPDNIADAAYVSATQSAVGVGAADSPDDFQYKTKMIRTYTAALRAALTLEKCEALLEVESAVFALNEAVSTTDDPDFEEMLGVIHSICTILSK